jgi:hypothetical protein
MEDGKANGTETEKKGGKSSFDTRKMGKQIVSRQRRRETRVDLIHGRWENRRLHEIGKRGGKSLFDTRKVGEQEVT